GPVGENAALFGDGTAASLLCAEPRGPGALPLAPVLLSVEGREAEFLQVVPAGGAVELRMKRFLVASRAVEVMAQSVKELAGQQGLDLSQVSAVVAHGGNGRLPGLLARKLSLMTERVLNDTSRIGIMGTSLMLMA